MGKNEMQLAVVGDHLVAVKGHVIQRPSSHRKTGDWIWRDGVCWGKGARVHEYSHAPTI